MLWSWWAIMFVAGLALGCLGAWTTNAARVFMKTLAIPLIVVVSRLAWPYVVSARSTPITMFVDFVILSVAALIADYLLGLKLGRNDRAGFRRDSVGH